jgi:hypothetical protein
MRKPWLLGFTITTVLLVAALVYLDAGPNQRARMFAQRGRSITLGEAHIDASIDRTFGDLGDTVHVKLKSDAVATVAVVTIGTTGQEDRRVEAPPRKISRKDIKLEAGVAMDVPVMLYGASGDRAVGGLGHYMTYVMSPENADAFERWRTAKGYEQRRRLRTKDWSLNRLFESQESRWAPIEHVAFHGSKTIAAFDCYARGDQKGFRVTAPDKAIAGSEFTATVEVGNKLKQPITMEVELDSFSTDDRSLGDGGGPVEIEPRKQRVELAAGETRKVSFKVTASTVRTIALSAKASCDDHDAPACLELAEKYKAGAFEAVQIVEEKKAVAKR